MWKLTVCVVTASLTSGCGDDGGGGSSGAGGDGGPGGTGGADIQEEAETICKALCDCTSCSSTELSGCEGEFAETEATAKAADCGGPYGQFLDCYVASVECVNGTSSLTGCDDELSSFYDCTGADPAGG